MLRPRSYTVAQSLAATPSQPSHNFARMPSLVITARCDLVISSIRAQLSHLLVKFIHVLAWTELTLRVAS